MASFSNSPFESTLEVVATLRDSSIRSSARAQREHEEFLSAVAQAYKLGVDINALSDESGLPVDQILAASELSDELADLAGSR